jgi:hypothetical protein
MNKASKIEYISRYNYVKYKKKEIIIDEYIDDKLIKSEKKVSFIKYGHCKYNIELIVGCNKPLDIIKDYDLSCVLNWFDGYNIYIGHLDSILTKTAIPNNTRKIRADRLNKYISRGYTHKYIDHTDDNLCTFKHQSKDIKYFKTNDDYNVIEHNINFNDLVDPEKTYKINIFNKIPDSVFNELQFIPPNNLLKEGGIKFQESFMSFNHNISIFDCQSN